MRATLLLAGLLSLAPIPLRAQLRAERVNLEVRIDPAPLAVYAKARLVLRNRNPKSRDIVELRFPAPLGSRVQVRAVWDRGGELGWRSDAGADGESRKLRIALRAPLRRGKKVEVVVSYDMDLTGFTSPEAPLEVSSSGARLGTTGWYPLPLGLDPAAPQRLRLSVRLPKEWRVSARARLKKLSNGTALASYELTLKRVEPGRWLLRAGTTLPGEALPSPAPRR
ncbi:MAG: hypothetical protein ACE5IP_03100 [Terriglobia bacterium]